MGIPSLMTYINNHSDRYYDNYDLCDTYLVIDGNSVACQIYQRLAKSNCAFGGDYDKYAQSVSDFFDILFKCNVKPLVIIDGARENKKLATVLSRTKQKIALSYNYFPINQHKMKFYPLLTKEVFVEVAREKNIQLVQCIFEADNHIAAVAKILDCPVCSYDSDFYVYGSKYIPFNTLNNCVVKRPNRSGYMIQCKLYLPQHVFNSFKGLNEFKLALAAVLLGNDYVKRGTFNNFFYHLKLIGASRGKHNRNQCRIETIFRWLSQYTLTNAVTLILSRVPKPQRAKLIHIIENNINEYTNTSTDILASLGFSENFVSSIKEHFVKKIYKYSDDIDTVPYKEEIHSISETCDKEEENEAEALRIITESEFIAKNAQCNNLPEWFIQQFLKAKYPTYFMELIIRHLYISFVLVEDFNCPASITLSLKIVSVIFELLKSDTDNNSKGMKYMARDHAKNLVCYELEGIGSTFPCKLPSLSNLGNISISIKHDILNYTLGITKQNVQCLSELPPEWRLYIASIKYWVEQQELYKSKEYLYSFFVSMLFHVIDAKIGKYRSSSKSYDRVIKVRENRKGNDCRAHYSMSITIDDACKEVDHDDCVIASSFYISHFNMNPELYTNGKKYNKRIVHAFSEFQYCLKHAMNLNALLSYPYSQTKFWNLYNGTLLYNLYDNFKTREDIDKYLNTILENSPSVLRLFNVILLKVKSIFPFLEQSANNSRKKQRKSKRAKPKPKPNVSDDDEYFSTEESSNEMKFCDPNNPFTVLNGV